MKHLLTLILTLAIPAAFAAESMTASGPVDITSQRLDVEQGKGLATFSGNVIVTQGSFRLEAPKVITDFGGGKGSDIKSVNATGGVTITRPGQGGITEKAVGTTASYVPGSQQLTLTGAVTLTRGPSQLSGDKLVYDIATGNARVTNSNGPVKARFVPQKK